MVGIYEIVNIKNNKIYIGQSVNIKLRKIHHFSALRNNKHTNNLLQNSWNKYGEENFKFEIIELCDEKLLDEREVYWIKHFKSNNFKYGFNLESGGTKHKRHNESSKRLMGIKSRNAIRTKEWKNKIGKAHRGKKLSKETKTKLKNINTGKKYSDEINIKKGKTGEKHHNTNLTNKIVSEIKLAMYCDMKNEDILQLFNIPQSKLYKIQSLETWINISSELNEYIQHRNKIYIQKKREEVLKLYNEGFKVIDISQMLHYDRTVIYDMLKAVR